jgi:hypothetical protein
MLSIQAAGQEILNNNPGKFYVFGGPEYGIKCKYLTAIKEHYNGEYNESPDFNSILSLMQVKQLIPLKPTLYIIRYDEEFLNDLKENTASIISNLKIIGTIVIIYHDSKSLTKCDKFLPNYTICFDPVATTFVQRYLKADYPNLSSDFINFAIKSRIDYKGANILSGLLDKISTSDSVDASQLEYIFYGSKESVEDHIKVGFASKNFEYLMQVLEIYPGELDSILYIMLNTLVEIDKLKVKKYVDSPLKPYLNNWSHGDIYNMYMFVFKSIETLRSISTDTYSQIIYIFSILQYSPIPAIDAMSYGDI